MEELEEYLKPTFTIESASDLIRAKACDLTDGQKDTKEKAISLFYFVRDQISYNMYVPNCLLEDFRASIIFQRGDGYCVQKAVLLTALARATGIPARLGFADVLNHMLPKRIVDMRGTNILLYHGFTELYLGERWIRATPAFDINMCTKYRIIPVEFNGKDDAKFHPNTKDGKPHIEYVKEHGHFPEVPIAEILNARMQLYGQEAEESWQKMLLERSK